MNIAAIYEEYLESDIVKFFREKRAFSQESSIAPNLSELTNKTRYKAIINLHSYKFLKRVPGTDKYYLNEDLYRKQTRLKLSIFFILGIALLLVCILIFSGIFKLFGYV